MKLIEFIPIKLSLFLIIGILLGVLLNIGPLLALVLLLISLFVLFLLFLTPKYLYNTFFGLFAVLATLHIGILASSLSHSENYADHYSHLKFRHQRPIHLKVKKLLKANFYSQPYIAEFQRVGNTPASGKILLSQNLKTRSKKLVVDDEIIILAIPKPIKAALNPHQFNYKKYLANLGIYHRINLSEQPYCIKEIPAKTVYGIAAWIRNTIVLKLIEAGIEKEQLGIIQALLLGERNDISLEILTNYKNAGAMHLLAVSGLHIGIILLLLQYLCTPLEFLPKGKTIKLLLIVMLLWVFALIAGFSASVVRAVSMYTFVAYAFYLNRPKNSFNILALSMFFILLVINPMFLLQPGFQMSYAAVLFIVWLYPKFMRFWIPRNKLVRKIWQLLSVSLAAQLGVLPISLYYFHQFPGLFFVSNLLIIPFLGLILGLGIAVISLALMNLLPGFLANFYSYLIKLMNTIVSWVAQQDAFIIKEISFDRVQLLLSYLVICSFIILLSNFSFKKIVLFLSAIMGLQAWGIYLLHTDINMQNFNVLHQTANTVILHQKGRHLVVYSADSIRASHLFRNYKVARRIAQVSHQKLSNSYSISKKKFLIVDSLAIFPLINTPDVILLTQSPRLNLERYLGKYSPQLIIADGSNYHSFISLWKKTCQQKKVPFHYTGEKGAYYFMVEN